MTGTPIEEAGTTPLEEALVEFTARMGAAVSDICSYGLTIGESYVPFDPDEDEDCDPDDVTCSQLWVRVTNVTPTAINATGFDGQQCDVTLDIGLEVGVLRCIEVREGGEAPTTSEVLAASLQAMQDMRVIQCAALGTTGDNADEIWGSVQLGGWAPLGPLGGQYGGVWTFTVEL